MSFMSNLFGGKDDRPVAAPVKATPPAPRIGDGETVSLQRAEGARMRRKRGLEDTILSGGLGDVGAPAQAAVQRTSLLGGG